MVVSSGFGEEFVGIDFGDKRLTKRVVRIAERFGKYCSLSIPAATDGRAEMEAAYRFMDNPKVLPKKKSSNRIIKTLWSGFVSVMWRFWSKTPRNWT